MTGQRAFLVADLAFGDSGKGTIVDWLTHTHAGDLIVRYNGGPQAGHNVVQADGRHHTFSQFGSGLFHPAARSLLAEQMLIEPYAMLNEAAHLKTVGVDNALARTIIDGRCRVITPPQQVANRIRERARGAAAHGTCGMGVGETVADGLLDPRLSLFAFELPDEAAVRPRLKRIMAHKREQLSDCLGFATLQERRVLEDDRWIDVFIGCAGAICESVLIASAEQVHSIVREARQPIFEGAQGILLDEQFGFHPHTTWSDATFNNAVALLEAADFSGDTCRMGVMRTYLTRHGGGPLLTEHAALSDLLREPHNTAGGWQGTFRCGVLDLVALRYALAAVGGVEAIALTHADRIAALPAVACDRYTSDGRIIADLTAPVSAAHLAGMKAAYCDWPTHSIDSFIDALQEALKSKVTVSSSGPTRQDKSTR